MSQEQINKLEAEKLERIVIFTIDFGSYHKFSTSDKEIAYKIWDAAVGQFFELEQPSSRDYSDPEFNYRKPIEVKLSAEMKNVWKDQESALRAYNAYKALSNKPKSKDD